ncbi:response regulator transcription factor [Azoarcus sp. KH32C]|uniref:response regulator n=1 Tax=Azoarcus sp. KH32C TaxID=748247 RepID=UPI000344F76B|nr:response regulator transcription factor [Azoarcus sp. KH32C]
MPCDTLAPPIEVLLVDDQRAILAGVTALIESERPCMRVAGCARSGPEALELACMLQPQVIVLDIDLGGTNGLDLIPLFNRCCSAAIIVFTCVAEPALRRRAQQLGAAAFVPKTASGDDLIAAIRAATD